MSSLPLKLRQLQGPLRRIIRWYLAPSGLLLAAALLVTVAAIVFRQPWLGLGAVALMSIFLPYGLSRQQGVAEDRLMAEVARLRGRHEQSEGTIALVATSNTDLSVGLSGLTEIVSSRGPQIESISTTQTDFTKMRLLIASRLSALDARVDEISMDSFGGAARHSDLLETQASIGEVRTEIDSLSELVAAVVSESALHRAQCVLVEE